MSAWKPGDVAMVVCSDGEERRASCKFYLGHLTWVFANGSMRAVDISIARPLVVIDPESDDKGRVGAAAIDALKRAGVDVPDTTNWDEVGETILRWLVPDPKPDQPKGLGAVVEDSEHRKWIRHSNNPGSFPWISEGIGARGWSEIAAVRVLSEGVQP